jgi:diguanylate cyclase (GGDEF)-like protein
MWDAVRTRQEIRLDAYSSSPYARKDGERRYENDRAFCLPLLAGKTVVGVLNLNDLSDEALSEENASSVRRLADHLALVINNISLYERNEQLVIVDELTQLYNRRFLYQELARELERAKRYDEKFSILMSDLDHFKKINDTHGHGVGDLVLKAAAAHFKANLRPSDFACRFGGEEFVLILPKTGGDDALRFAERIRQSLAEQTVSWDGGKSLRATISIGIAEFAKSDTLDSLLSRADAGLYLAKEQGRNRCVFQPLPKPS